MPNCKLEGGGRNSPQPKARYTLTDHHSKAQQKTIQFEPPPIQPNLHRSNCWLHNQKHINSKTQSNIHQSTKTHTIRKDAELDVSETVVKDILLKVSHSKVVPTVWRQVHLVQLKCHIHQQHVVHHQHSHTFTDQTPMLLNPTRHLDAHPNRIYRHTRGRQDSLWKLLSKKSIWSSTG